MPLKLEKHKNCLFLQNHFAFTSGIKPCQIFYGFMKTTLFLTLHYWAFTKTPDIFNKNKRYHIIFEGWSSVCTKLESASFKNNENTRDTCPAKIYACSLFQGF